jgi:hypothetical protein
MGKTFSTGLLTNGIWQDASNNIGIGAAPSGSYKLEVTGAATFSSTLLVSGLITGSSGATISGVGGANPLLLTNTDYNTGTSTGSSMRLRLGAASGNTYSDIQAIMSGGASLAILALNPSGGNVGIGTSTVPAKLTIYTGVGGAFPATSGTTQSNGLVARYKDTSNACIDYGTNGGSGGWLQVTNITDLSSAYPFLINPNGGNVGIGVTSPSVPLEVYSSGGGPTLRITSSYTGTGSGNGFHIGTDASPLNVAFVQNENASQVFYTNNGTSTDERMRILNDNTVCFGKTVYDNSTTGVSIADTKTTAIVSVVTDAGVSILMNRKTSTGDMVVFRYNGSNVGYISTNGSTITFSGNALSDNRYKDNIEKITNAVDAINKVDWVTFKYKDNQRDSAGVTAQQLQTVPELLKFVIDGIDEDSYKAVDYNAIIGYLGAAIKEQQAIITSLQDRLTKGGL